MSNCPDCGASKGDAHFLNCPRVAVMGTCRGCKHWGAPSIMMPNYSGDKRGCSASIMAAEDDLLWVVSSEDLHDMLTAPNFGCVLFEERE